MKLTILGTGTSQGVPVIGCRCEVCQAKDERDKGLRTSKLSYKPVELLEKYAVVVEDGPCPGREGKWTVLEADIG